MLRLVIALAVVGLVAGVAIYYGWVPESYRAEAETIKAQATAMKTELEELKPKYDALMDEKQRLEALIGNLTDQTKAQEESTTACIERANELEATAQTAAKALDACNGKNAGLQKMVDTCQASLSSVSS